MAGGEPSTADRVGSLARGRHPGVVVNTRRPPSPPPRRQPPHNNLKRWMPAIAAAGVLGVVVFIGFSGGDDGSDASAPGTNPGAIDASLTVPASTAAPVVVVTDPAVQKSQLSQTLRRGMFGDEVRAMQQRLKDFGFDPGPVDGQFGSGTEQALWAFEGLVLQRPYDQQTGELTNELWQTMQDPIVFGPRRQGGAGNTHMEIYLDLQAAIVFKDDKPALITHISSGSGERWCEIITQDTDEYGVPLPEPVKKDVCGISKTPGGVFKFYRRVAGNRQGPLGGMYNPVYFNYGIAVHGAKNVPDEPASHGCIRIPMWISEYFPSLVDNGNRVYVWDGVKEPEQQSKKDMLPVFNFANPDATTTTSTTTTTTTLPPATTKPPATTTTTAKPPATTTTAATVPPATSTTAPPAP